MNALFSCSFLVFVSSPASSPKMTVISVWYFFRVSAAAVMSSMLLLFSLSAELTCAGFLCLRRAWGRNRVVNVVPSALVLCFPVVGSVTGMSLPNFWYFASFLEMSRLIASMDAAASKIDLCSSSGCVAKTCRSGASSDPLLIDFIISLGLLSSIEVGLLVIVEDSATDLALSLLESPSYDISMAPPLSGALITLSRVAISSLTMSGLVEAGGSVARDIWRSTMNGLVEVGGAAARDMWRSIALLMGLRTVYGGLVLPKGASSCLFSAVKLGSTVSIELLSSMLSS